MSSITKTEFYCDGGLIELADIDSATSEATGYPKEHLLDGSLITSWKPTTTADQSIIIDLNYVPGLTSYLVGFFMRNYTTDPGAGRFRLDLSANGTDWTEANDYLISILATANTPVHYHIFTAPLTRYMKLSFTGMSAIIEISHLFIANYFTGFDASGTCQLPRLYGDSFSRISNAEGRSSLRRYIPAYQETRNYLILSSTTYTIWQALKDASQGGNRLVLVVDWIDGTEQAPFVARLGDITFRQTAYDIWEVSLQIARQPYVHPTYGY
jgi:hypothetical protein